SEDALARATALGDMWLDSISVTWLVVLFVGLLLPARGRAGRIVRSTAPIVALTWLGTAGIAPNTGALQIGPRYLLVAVALVVFCLALGLTQLRLVSPVPRATVVALVLAVSALAAHENVTDRATFLEENYRRRIWLALAAIQRRPGEAVVFAHPWAPGGVGLPDAKLATGDVGEGQAHPRFDYVGIVNRSCVHAEPRHRRASHQSVFAEVPTAREATVRPSPSDLDRTQHSRALTFDLPSGSFEAATAVTSP
ncbi:MAG TPA: hypothetical protein RMH99_26850, partial [Sandaracinaceae bacterium LLY-WYZ-13_1]|nr:hypothetical protein [Sandaracinaceae bacterium LLY-WYZ-13_1]